MRLCVSPVVVVIVLVISCRPDDAVILAVADVVVLEGLATDAVDASHVLVDISADWRIEA